VEPCRNCQLNLQR